ncbi:hypothetical protein ACQVRV_00290 (plasmid) [Ralstonia pseudosolanacearum]
MRTAKTLFARRRWMLWLPVLIAGLASASVQEFGKFFVGGLVLWIPYWLAWWLSDGFRGSGCGTSSGYAFKGVYADGTHVKTDDGYSQPHDYAPHSVGTPTDAAGSDLYWNFEEGSVQAYIGTNTFRIH